MTVKIIYGEYLNISKVTREDMGAYLCIASNGIQPSTSKRIFLAVNCKLPYIYTTQLSAWYMYLAYQVKATDAIMQAKIIKHESD